MKDLEKIFKEKFEGYEPEVNPQVWDQLQHGLDHLPAAQAATQEVVKGAFIKGNIAWISGAIITAGLTALLLVQQNNKKEISDRPEPVIQMEQPAVAPPTQYPIEDPAPLTVPVQKQIQEVAAAPVSLPSAEVPTVVTDASPINETSVQRETTPDTKPAEHMQPATVEEEAPKETLDKHVPLAIIVNGTTGFAPFKVVCMLNDAMATGDWDFGDGYATTGVNSTSHTYNRPGSYTITGTAKGISAVREIEVLGTVGTAFTPNGDGQNDEFFVDAPGLIELRVKIFNRSGNLEYEITQPAQRWDGKNRNGKDLPAGTYFYDIFARSHNGQTVIQKGTINIFR